MNDSRAMSKSERLDEMSNGKRTAIIVLVVVVIGAVVGLIVKGFRGRHIALDAAAMTAPVPGQVAAPRPASSPSSPTP